ncbi:MAG: CBS domain-containing protein [Candidatus Verstraetearchaeota archaeon]|nr:CBS domain-containing protein [Candidatus Verstraetearchaeota archaeon]
MYEKLCVKDFMTKNVIYCEVPSTRTEVLAIMKKHKVTCLPVVKKGTRKLVGLVTRFSFLEKPSEEQTALVMMRNPLHISPSSSIKDAVHIFVKHNIRYLPVVDQDELVGIITISDIVYKLLTNSMFNYPIKEFMEKKVIAVWDATPINVAWKIMELSKVPTLLVINTRLEVVGTFSISDIFNHADIIMSEYKSSLKASVEGQEWDWDSLTIIYIGSKKLTLPEKPISEIMSHKVNVVREETPINQCAKKMRDLDTHLLPVVDINGNLIGVVSDFNLIQVLLK